MKDLIFGVDSDWSPFHTYAMTLILTAMNARCVVQISDRRLTAAGALVDDEANKAISLTTPDARLTVGFTGLARVGAFDTRNWVMDAIATAAIIDASAAGIISRIANIATKKFADSASIRRVSTDSRRLDIVFSGYHYGTDPPLMVYARVTNLLADGSIGRFWTEWGNENRNSSGVAAWLSAAGYSDAIQPDDVALIVSALRKHVSPEDLQAVMQNRISRIADRPASGGLIGKQFDSIILEREGGPVRTMYDSAVIKGEVHMAAGIFVQGPNQVAMFRDATMRAANSNEPMIVPRVHRNAPCPCGSKKRYRECHGLTLRLK